MSIYFETHLEMTFKIMYIFIAIYCLIINMFTNKHKIVLKMHLKNNILITPTNCVKNCDKYLIIVLKNIENSFMTKQTNE